MPVKNEAELLGMQNANNDVVYTLKAMIDYASPEMSTKELHAYGVKILSGLSAKPEPYLTYWFPGWSCMSVDKEFCHGVPFQKRIQKEGD